MNSSVSLKSALLLSSAQDGIYALGKAHISSTPSLRSFLKLPLKQFQCSSDDSPLSSFQRRSSSASSFQHLSRPGDRWCDVLGFVPAGRSLPQALQHFRSSEKQATTGQTGWHHWANLIIVKGSEKCDYTLLRLAVYTLFLLLSKVHHPKTHCSLRVCCTC